MSSSDEIREQYLAFFEARGHLRIPSASLVPAASDTSALLTVAGMHPLKPYFLGEERPPAPRLTSCQKVFRTVDLDVVGSTARHLTLFEMLGNFSFGDYFKDDAVRFAWELSRDGFGFPADRIWITVFAGDDELGLGPDEEAIAAWQAVGVPRERIVPCPRSENFWQAGPTGPCGPCSELYLDRGLEFGEPSDLPGGENARFLEYWNLVFMQFDQRAASELVPLPARNIDTGLGLNRMAVILQDVPSVFETDQFAPLIALGEELSGRRYGEQEALDRSLRILADHARAMTFLVADGVVPSNEERGYVLRRVMRRAIQQGRALHFAPGFLRRYSEVVRETMGSSYPELFEQREAIDTWLAAEEEHFGHTLDQGLAALRELIERARERSGSVGGEDAFRLHDTFGFPFELTAELVAAEGLELDAQGFEERMADQRARSRSAAAGAGAAGTRELARRFAASGGVTRFVGYETTDQATTVAALAPGEGGVLVKLAESPFYAAGGGQISDGGVIECAEGDCRARVADVVRIGEDQALLVVCERGELTVGERVLAHVDRRARHATQCNHTATHLLHAALRRRLGSHVRQAGSYVGPDKLRFDFSHGAALSAQELRDVEDLVNDWIAEAEPVRAITTTLEEARSLGAMALFGEKYGELVRMVEVGEDGRSRELCGGTHVGSTAEIGVMRILTESSSAANVRRIEALTGPAAAELLLARDRTLSEIGDVLRSGSEDLLGVVRAREQQRLELIQRARREPGGKQPDIERIAEQAITLHGARVLCAAIELPEGAELLDVLDRVRGRVGDAAIVLASGAQEKVRIVASVAPALVARGVRAGELVRRAALEVGGGGGGRDTLAQAGGRDVQRIPEALEAARAAIAEALGAG